MVSLIRISINLYLLRCRRFYRQKFLFSFKTVYHGGMTCFVLQASKKKSCSKDVQTNSNNNTNCASRFGQNTVVTCVIYNISSFNRTLLTTLDLVSQSLRPIAAKKIQYFKKGDYLTQIPLGTRFLIYMTGYFHNNSTIFLFSNVSQVYVFYSNRVHKYFRRV